jgi:DNA-binding CsgD family transcriptional regulator
MPPGSGYKMFNRFIETYLPRGFKDIDPNDVVVQSMERQLDKHKQFIYVGDLINLKIFYHSKCVKDFFGIEPEDIEPSVYFSATHPDDMKRHGIARSRYMKLGTDIYNNKSGELVISTNLRIRNYKGIYANLLFQAYVFYSDIPYPSAYAIMVHTDVTEVMKRRHGYHYYIGSDFSYFRFPDEKLLMTGNVFSDREFDVIKQLAEGNSSHQIATKLFLSVHTVNTHRRNILKKTGKASTHELIMDLKERGVI